MMMPRIFVFATVALNVLNVGTMACHSNCECKWKQGKRWANCPGKNMFTVPSGLSSEVQVINLERNNFQTLPTRIFQERGLTNLQKIYLQHCRLGRVAEDSLHQLTNLVELDLSDNLLTEVPTKALKAANHLRKLHLNNNPIPRLTGNTFQGLQHLQHLSLSGCQLAHIDAAAFGGLESLISLYLDNNRLKMLRAETVSTLPRLAELTLTGNPWHCDCQLAPLRKWMILRSIGNLYAPHCALPDRIREVPWTELDVEDFACAPEITLPLNMPFIHVEEGTNITLVCGVRSQPMTIIRWEAADFGNETYMDPNRFTTTEQEQGQGVHLSSLHIYRTQVDDSGIYMCVSENKAGTTAANFTVHVTKQLLSTAHLGKTGTIGVITFFVLLAILIALGLCLFVMRQRHRANTDTKAPLNQGFLKQLAVVKTVKGQPEVIPVVASSPKSELDGADKRTENGSSGYGSDQTPDLVNKIGGFDKELHLYNSPVGNGYVNPADPAYRNSPIMSALNTTYQQDDYALGPIPGESDLLSRVYSPEPLPPIQASQPAPHWSTVISNQQHPQHPEASYYAQLGQGWVQGSLGSVDSSVQMIGLPVPLVPMVSAQQQQQQQQEQQHFEQQQAGGASIASWGPAPAVPPRVAMGALVSPHVDTRYSPDEGYAEETICYEGTEV
ncbi:leucine-rich repeat and fibronectin type-III domain-containing protein 5-like [Tropilaelaps mercedesae]|uniref:Leucine-rich repeat and fibronectin type-III domain-containing protein 5-like n=1 Tax=Tropilaelaps mercedesae TaxID=418985 RepID=A0A1V9X4Y2_9ACAR|nr:leucine-rich repeat and fibronectin type-III domain-containing protein 5-like [Tropilaelaps mercedesae]